MGVFEGHKGKQSSSLFESRGGGRHVAFTALRPTVPEPDIMTAERLTRGEQRMIRREPVLKFNRVRPGVGKPYPEAVIQFKREAAAAYAPMDFQPKGFRRLRGGPADIRPMGPYELPDYSSGHSSAEGLSYFGQDAAPAPVTAPAGDSWWKKLAPMAQQAYDAYKGTAKPATDAGYPSPAASYPVVAANPGMSATTITLLVGGGVAVVGIVALFLLRK